MDEKQVRQIANQAITDRTVQSIYYLADPESLVPMRELRQVYDQIYEMKNALGRLQAQIDRPWWKRWFSRG